MVFKVIVIELTGKETVIDLCDTEEQFKTITVEQLKEETSKRTGIPKDRMRPIFEDKINKILEDGRLLSDYGIQHMSRILLILRLQGGGQLGEVPVRGGGGMGDKDKNRSKEFLAGF